MLRNTQTSEGQGPSAVRHADQDQRGYISGATRPLKVEEPVWGPKFSGNIEMHCVRCDFTNQEVSGMTERKRRPLPPKKLEILGNSLFRKLTRIFHLSGELA